MDSISLLYALFVVLLISAILSISLRHYYILRRKLKNIPQCGIFPIGVAFEILQLTDYGIMKWLVERMLRFKKGIFIFWIGTKPFISLHKPEFFKIILSSTVHIEKGKIYRLMHSWLGKGLFTSSGEQWSHDRKLIAPTFHFSIVDQFAVVMSEKAEILIKCLEKEIAKNPGNAINIFSFTNNAALDVICETAMGVDVHAQEVESKYVTTIHRTSKLIRERLFQPWLWPDWVYNLFPIAKEYESGVNRLHKFTREVINKKKIARQLQNGTARSENEDYELDIGKRKRKAFLDLLLDLNEKEEVPLTDNELRAHVDTFMFAGYDTTSVAITWTLFLLGNNLEHQEKVHEELEEVFKDSETPASLKELSQLKYLERSIKETLRLFPSVPLFLRHLTEDVNLGEHMIPKGVTVVIDVFLMQRNPRVWSDPEKFDPDRFLPENSKNRNAYAYIPFGAGSRNCIGKRFSLLEEKTILTAILRKWRVKSVKTPDKIQFGPALILRPCEDVLIYFTPKENNN